MRKFVTFATAGHVDHGKTSLIKALTGIDTDRLAEEKQRGLSIDIGFAYLDFPEESLRLEIIDIPGHERFIKNAIAGLVAVSGVILVVDSIEGVKPQTEDHLKVACALGLKKGVAVLTKTDRAEEKDLLNSEKELRKLLAYMKLDIPLLKVSSVTGKGLEELKRTLKEVALQIREEYKVSLPLRIFIDSAFTVKGYGTVVRGSCVEGRVKVGEYVAIEPLGIICRVRKIQNHGVFVKEAVAGERVALNIPDLEKENIKRGFWILERDTYIKSRTLIVNSDKEIKPGKTYRFFFGMKEVEGRFRLLKESVYILKLSEEVVTKRGDRVVVLDSCGKPVCGVQVLHPSVKVLKKNFIRGNMQYLFKHFEVYVLKERASEGVKESDILKLTNHLPNAEILSSEGVKIGNTYYSKEYVADCLRKLKELLAGREYAQKEDIRKKLGVSVDLLKLLVNLTEDFKIEEELLIRKAKDIIHQREIDTLIKLTSQGIRKEEELLSSGFKKETIKIALKKGYIHRIGDNLFLSESLLRFYVDKLREKGEEFTLQEAKSVLGLTRKYLIPLLEYLDLLKITRRQGNKRYFIRTPPKS